MDEKKIDEIRKQVLDYWKKTVNQIEDLYKKVLESSGLNKIKLDKANLLMERDRLIKRLGEETYHLIEQRKIMVPKPVQSIYVKIRTVMDRLIIQGGKKPAKKAVRGKKKAA
jgi:hypothetical protein